MNEQNVILEEDGFEEEIDVLEETSVTLAMWGDITGNIENQTDLQNALDAKQDSLSQAQLEATNSGITSAKVAKYDGYEATINAKADQSALDAETIARGEADTALGTRIDNEVTARQTADNGLQSQIDAITSKSDVVDVVANYAALQNYDTSALGNNDVVKVLDDETHEDALTYYRWNATARTWSYIGQEAPYYSKGQMDVFLQGKQDKLTAGNNVQIQNNVISATDTTYTAGNGLDLNGTEFSADTTVLATKEDLEGYYTKSETDTLIEPKLEVEVVDQLPTTGEEAKLYLTPKAHTEQTATGNPINLNITEGAGKIDSAQIDGDTFQQSYEGKNLFNYQGANVRTGYVINDSGVEVSDSTGGYTRQFSKVTPNTAYILSPLIGAGTRRVYYFDSDKSFISRSSGYISSTSIAFTTPANCYYVDFQIYTRGEQDQVDMRNWQLELGSTATTYEPYVGGVPSPNPDYPQAIQTVTGLQTVTVVGKNLYDKNTAPVLDAYISAGVTTITYNNANRLFYIPCLPSTTYTFQKISSAQFSVAYTHETPALDVQAYGITVAGSATTVTITTDSQAKYLICRYYQTAQDTTPQATVEASIQVEIGDTATTYAPYHATNYPISLGNIELCKLGNYQDCIYKDGDNWKVHKATGKISLTGNENWSGGDISEGFLYIYTASYDAAIPFNIAKIGYSNVADIYDGVLIAGTSVSKSTFSLGSNLETDSVRLRFKLPSQMVSSRQEWASYLRSYETTVYYTLATPTDTTITDQALIAQLEAVANASLASGSNTITNSATGDNLAGDLEISYHGFDPRNRYDKWLWLDINNEYEQLGS